MPRRDIITIGASAGGLEALLPLVRGLPADLPVAIFVVLHTSSQSPAMLARILTREGSLSAVTAQHDEAFVPGTIYVAPPDYHLFIRRGRVELSHGPRENHTRPAINPLFRTAARAYGPRVVGVVLSGALDDGAAGLMAIASRGGVTLVQDPVEALVDAMPRAALAAVSVDYTLSVREMPAALTMLAQDEHAPEREQIMPDTEDDEDTLAVLPRRDIAAQVRGERANQTTIYTCPDCGGALWQADEGKLVQFTCHVGHRFAAETLLGQIAEELEGALWRCIRILTEKATLTRQLAEQVRASGNPDHAARIEEQVGLDERHQALLHALLDEGTLGQVVRILHEESGEAG